MSQNRSKRIFVSHAAADKHLAGHVVDLLGAGMGIDVDKDVFCTSLEGMRIPPGRDFKSFIKEQIRNPKIVLLLISKNYVASQFCLAEVGASWAMSRRVVPLIIPPATFDDMKAVLTNLQAVKIDDAMGWNDVLTVFKEEMKISPSTNRWEEKRSQALRHIKRKLRHQASDAPKPTMHDLLKGSGGFVDRDERSNVSQQFAASTLRTLDIFAGDLSWLAEDLFVYKMLRKRGAGVNIRILTDTVAAPAIKIGKRIGIDFRAYPGGQVAPLKASVSDAEDERESRAFVVKRLTPRTAGKTGYDYWVKVYHGEHEYAPIKAMGILFNMLFTTGRRI